MRKKGSITVYAALILGVMMTLIVTCLTSARMAAARAQIASGAQVGLYSAFSLFDRELLEDYEVFALNLGGSSSQADLASFCRTVESYMEGVLRQNSQNLNLTSLGFSGYRLLTDEGGEPFYRQAVLYEKDVPDSAEMCDRLRRLKDYSREAEEKISLAMQAEEEDWFGRYDAALEEAERLSHEALFAEEEVLLTDGSEEELYIPYEEADFTTVSDPVPVIRSIMETGVLAFLLPGAEGEAFSSFPSSPLLSQRTALYGMEVYDGFSPDSSEASELLFQCYIHEKLGNYLRPKDGFPSYQMEYILERENSDRENLERTVTRIFLLRLGTDLEMIGNSEECQMELTELAERICSVFIVPPDQSIVYDTLKYSWACGEALCECRHILSGGHVGFMDGGTISVPLSGLYDIMDYLDSAADEGAEGSYEDYLALFMLGRTKEELLEGTMDAVEGAVRASGRSGFFIDHCLVDAEISADVRANGRKTFHVTKAYGYD